MCICIIINGSKISVNGFIATTLFRMMEECPHSSSSSESRLNYKHWQFKSKLEVAMRYKNSKAVSMRCENKGKPKARATKIALLYNKVLDYISVSVGARTWLLVPFL